MLDCLCALFGVRVCFHSREGEELRVGLQKPICRYCRLIQERLFSKGVCAGEDRKRRTEAEAIGKMLVYQCHAGLTEAVIPVHAGDRLIGFAVVGQFRLTDAPPVAVAGKWRKETGTPELEDAFRQVPRLPRERMDYVLRLFSLMVRYISSGHLVDVRNERLLHCVIARMQEHPEERLSLKKAAALSFRSVSSLSHQFNRQFGKGFKRMQIEIKLDKAEEYFRATPDITISEVSAKLGFDDPHYFSRLFRKHRGVSPRQFLASVRKKGQPASSFV